MRILSPFKDFYDFVVYETDNRKVYIRETKEVVFEEEEHKKFPTKTILSPIGYDELDRIRIEGVYHFEKGYVSVVAFCDKLRAFLVYDNLIYWHYEDIPEKVLKTLQKLCTSRWSSYKDGDYGKYSWNRDPLKDILHYEKIDWILEKHTKEPTKTKLNKIYETPVLILNGGHIRNIQLNPKLTDIGFNKTMTPIEAYQEIYNWIPYNEPQVPTSPDDMSRYEAKGFDKKTSFRPNMK